MASDHVRDLIQVILVDGEDDPRVRTSIEGLGPKKAATVVSAAFTEAVLDKWRHGATLENIRDYVREVRAQVESENKPSQHVAEALIRAVLHEDLIIRDIPGDEVFRGQIWLTYEIVNGRYTDEAARQRFVDETVTVANQWLEQA